MKTAVAADEPDFQEWLWAKVPAGYRRGQHLFNTAPSHIQTMVQSVMELDPFYVDSPEQIYILNNFLAFAELCWDVHDEEELRLARKMVMDEPNARRRW